MTKSDPNDAQLEFTVASVWREERVSCPHPDILRAYDNGGLDGGAAEFLAFHLEECQCPYCNAVLDDLRARSEEGSRSELEGMRERLLRSTIAQLKRK